MISVDELKKRIANTGIFGIMKVNLAINSSYAQLFCPKLVKTQRQAFTMLFYLLLWLFIYGLKVLESFYLMPRK